MLSQVTYKLDTEKLMSPSTSAVRASLRLRGNKTYEREEGNKIREKMDTSDLSGQVNRCMYLIDESEINLNPAC